MDRYCRKCGKKLSDYNPDDVCFFHNENKEANRCRFEIIDILNNPVQKKKSYTPFKKREQGMEG